MAIRWSALAQRLCRLGPFVRNAAREDAVPADDISPVSPVWRIAFLSVTAVGAWPANAAESRSLASASHKSHYERDRVVANCRAGVRQLFGLGFPFRNHRLLTPSTSIARQAAERRSEANGQAAEELPAAAQVVAAAFERDSAVYPSKATRQRRDRHCFLYLFRTAQERICMWNTTARIFASLGLLGAAALMPLAAQDYSKFAFNVGGGISTPLNPTGAYAGVSGNLVLGAGYNINKSNAIIGEFLDSGLPSNLSVLQPVKAPSSSISLYSLTVNYRHQFDRISGSPFGLYFMGGGGWYHRYITIDKNYTLPAAVPCLPYWSWYGYSCVDGFVYPETVAKQGVSAGGFNTGIGFTIRLADTNLRFFTEARYHYAFSEHVPTTVVPVTFGIRYN